MNKILLAFISRKTTQSKTGRLRHEAMHVRSGIKAGGRQCTQSCKGLTSEQS